MEHHTGMVRRVIYTASSTHRGLSWPPTTEGSGGHRIAGVENQHFSSPAGHSTPLAARALETLLHLFEDRLRGDVLRLGLKVSQQSMTQARHYRVVDVVVADAHAPVEQRVHFRA